MAAFDFEALEQKHGRYIDVFIGILVAGGIIGLFVFDLNAPRGEVDGIGYAALVALCVRFGGRLIVATAILTTILTVLAAPFLPDSGISIAGMWANRGFAIVEIWIVAGILLRRLWLEAYIITRETRLQNNQATLGTIIREGLLSQRPQEECIRSVTELAAAAMRCDFSSVLQAGTKADTIRAVDIWDSKKKHHFTVADVPANPAPDFRRRMESEFAVYAEDILQSPIHETRLNMLRPLGIRAVLVADTFIKQPGLGAVAFAFREPHRWTAQEIAFARSAAHLVALLFTINRNNDIVATLDQVSEGVYAEDRDGIVQYANQTAKTLSWRVPDDQYRRFPRPPEALSGASDLREIRHNGKDLEIRRVRLPNGGLLARIYDVTARNAALAERQRYEARLQQSAKMEAIGQLAGGVAHDFNNVLGSIMGFGGFLAQDLPQNSAEHRFAERILSACQRGKDLVEQILAFARARAVERGIVDIGLLLKQSEEFLSGILPAHVKLNISLADSALSVFGSPTQISQLVTNLCTNARDAFEGKEGTIDITARAATVQEIASLKDGPRSQNERAFGDLHSGSHYCLLRVADAGSGMPAEILDRVFEPFFTTKGRHRGTGLGLAVVHGVVESAGGMCHLVSSPGEGTIFSVYFPVVNEAGLAASKPKPFALRGTERVLIVDDEPDIADMLAIGLERLGYETVGANDPLEALAAFAEQPDAFDVVVTDQVMPGMRGLDLIRQLKALKPDIKAILCTGYSDGANAAVAREAGADAFFNKPVDAMQIAPKIRALMSEGNQGPDAQHSA